MSKLVKIKLDNEVIVAKSLNLSDKLNKIRELIKEKTSKDFVFLFDGTKLDKEEEKNINLEEIIANKNEILLSKINQKKIFQLENFLRFIRD